ncbi:MAG: hypothetical protein ABSA10_01370 [Anaerolineales bacterium]|jgi:hypothetical protein
MNDNKIPRRTPAFSAALAGLFGFLMKYSAYNFLTGVVLLCFTALTFAYITFIGPRVFFSKYLAFLIPVDSQGTATIGASDILRMFSLLSLIFMILAITGTTFIRGLREVISPAPHADGVENPGPANTQSIRQSIRAGTRRFVIGCIAITLFFLAAFIAIPYAKLAVGTSPIAMFALFGFFYLMAFVSNGVYILMDVVSDGLLDWARVNFPWPVEREPVT